MKTNNALLAGLILVFSVGCSHQHPERLRAEATKRSYPAAYDRVWPAAVSACQMGTLHVDEMNRDKGFIAAHTDKGGDTWGEEVAVWVTRAGDNQTAVEVVSRRVGPSLLIRYDWEEPILNNIAVNLDK